MTQLRRGQVALEIPGHTEPLLLRWSMGAIEAIEEQFDAPFLEVVSSFTAGQSARLTPVLALFMAAVAENHPTLTEEAARSLISDAGIGHVLAALGKAVTAAFPSPAAKDAEKPDAQEPTSPDS